MFKNILVYVFYAVISSYGLYKLKISSQILDIHFIIGFIFYGMGFLMWLFILKLHPLSIAFPIASGTLIVCTQIVGILFLNEKIGVLQSVGVTLICLGIIFTFFSNEVLP
jgi:multidrug transporter EmrE-like cation transporter